MAPFCFAPQLPNFAPQFGEWEANASGPTRPPLRILAPQSSMQTPSRARVGRLG